jgi:tetratricopeptide (TPR) repeat protein
MGTYYGRALTVAREIGSKDAIAKAAYNLAFAYIVPGTDVAEALILLEEAVDLYRELGDRAGQGRAAFALAGALSQGPDRPHDVLVRAQASAAEALEAHRGLGNQFDLAWDLHMMAFVALKLGDLETARRGWSEATQFFIDVEDASGMVLMLSNFGELAKASGDLERHDTLVGAWTALAKQTGVGLTALFGVTDGRMQAVDVPVARQPAVQRGLAMKLDDALAYALATEPAKTA